MAGNPPITVGEALALGPVFTASEWLALAPLLVDRLNAQWRAVGGALLSGADKQSVADTLRVTRRTVERWTTAAGQQRRAFPLNLGTLAPTQWPARYRERLYLTVNLYMGRQSPFKDLVEPAEFTERFCGIEDLNAWMRDVAAGTFDPWLTAVWREMAPDRDDATGEWLVRVVYENAGNSPQALPYAAAAAREEIPYPAPPEPLIPLTDEWAGVLFSVPVRGFDYARGDWASGSAYAGAPTVPKQTQPGRAGRAAGSLLRTLNLLRQRAGLPPRSSLPPEFRGPGGLGR